MIEDLSSQNINILHKVKQGRAVWRAGLHTAHGSSSHSWHHYFPFFPTQLAADFNLRIQNEHVTQTDTSTRRSSSQPPPEITIYPPGDELRSRYSASAVGQTANQNDSKETDQTASHPSQYNPALASDEEFYRKALEEGKPPILSCDDILFTHFQIVVNGITLLIQYYYMTSVLTFKPHR